MIPARLLPLLGIREVGLIAAAAAAVQGKVIDETAVGRLHETVGPHLLHETARGGRLHETVTD